MNPPSTHDDDLRALLLAGDSSALDGLFDRYGGMLHACLLAVTGDHHLAADALQDVFVRIAEDPRRLGRADNMPGYLMRMVRNRGIDLARQRKSVAMPDDVVGANPATIDEGDTAAVRRALSRLPDEQREVVVLKIVEEHTFASIATLLNISINTAASRYRYGLEKLHDCLSEVPHAS